jgi:hypothetical protein
MSGLWYWTEYFLRKKSVRPGSRRAARGAAAAAGHGVQPRVELVRELPRRDERLEVAVRRGDEPHVHAHVGRAAEPS